MNTMSAPFVLSLYTFTTGVGLFGKGFPPPAGSRGGGFVAVVGGVGVGTDAVGFGTETGGSGAVGGYCASGPP